MDELLDRVGKEQDEKLYCNERSYSLEVPSRLRDQITFDDKKREISIKVVDDLNLGINVIILNVVLNDYPNIEKAIIPLSVEVLPCRVKSVQYKSNPSLSANYELYLGSLTVSIPSILVQPDSCTFDISSYTLTAGGKEPSWITINSSYDEAVILSSDKLLEDQVVIVQGLVVLDDVDKTSISELSIIVTFETPDIDEINKNN